MIENPPKFAKCTFDTSKNLILWTGLTITYLDYGRLTP